MTTINILILALSILSEEQEKNRTRHAAEKRDQEMAEVAAAQMEAGYKAAHQISREDPLFTDGFWICDKGDTWGTGTIRSPNQCPFCQSRLFKWVPGR